MFLGLETVALLVLLGLTQAFEEAVPLLVEFVQRALVFLIVVVHAPSMAFLGFDEVQEHHGIVFPVALQLVDILLWSVLVATLWRWLRVSSAV